ncbi:MarR family winged helix-turn-helix transcriptional regulator [Pseudonocardia humida]|uniref:MarR family transcriptional regulator n=1 Tax=Pseudonocardia humida TaxID=2800819 RepID=A0ABT1A601_9PSEU|nr:MarR family transcriptional regulator [Pseudonocardia humida]MCO1658356.1 MarR family transcriptional regulator [Pseudonocardia humida]
MSSRDDAERAGRALLSAHEASWALWAVLRTADEAQHALARDLGMTHTDARALDHVLSTPEQLGPVELGRRLGMSSASATAMVDRMVTGGHLARRPHPGDRRRQVLVATDRARTVAVAAMTPLLRALDAIAEDLDEAASTAVVGYLRAVAETQRAYGAGRGAR